MCGDRKCMGNLYLPLNITVNLKLLFKKKKKGLRGVGKVCNQGNPDLARTH